MTDSLPLFSVVIPVYNVAPYVKATVESVLRQTEGDFELILVNDGSTDGSLQVIQEIKDSRIRIVDKKNTGVSDTRNEGCRRSRGRYIAFLDADDYWYPDHLGEALAFFETHPDVPWYGGGCLHIPSGTEPPPQTTVRTFHVRRFFEDGRFFLNSSVLVIRRDLFAASGGFPVGMRHEEDDTFVTRIARHHRLVGSNDRITTIYYRRPGSASFNLPVDIAKDFEKLLRAMSVALREQPVEVPLYPRVITRELLKSSLFIRPEAEMLSLLDDFGFILPSRGSRRWRRFVKAAYRLARHSGLDEDLRRFVATPLRGRLAKTVEFFREKGVGAAVAWTCVITLYALRGMGDAFENRRDRQRIAAQRTARDWNA